MSRQLDIVVENEFRDGVDERRVQWSLELPDLDTRGMAILGRARWIALSVRPQIEAVFKAHGLDGGEADVLFTLLRSGYPYRLRPTELFRSLMISSGGMTYRLVRLEKAGLVSRPVAEGDGRSLPVQLTDKGITCAKAAFQQDMAVEAAILEGLSQEDQSALSKLLRKLSLSIARSTVYD